MLRRQLALSALALTAVILAGCQDSDGVSPGAASLVVRARIVQPPSKAQAAQQTTWDSLVITVLASPQTVRRAIPLSMTTAIAGDTIDGLPAGDDARVSVVTLNRAGVVVHRAAEQQVDLVAGQTATLSFWLNPARGSIYVELADVPTSVSTVQACFVADSGTFCDEAARAAKTWLAIDFVPDGAAGVLHVAGLDTAGDTLYASSLALTFYADRNTTVWTSFAEAPAGLALDLQIAMPGVTVVAGAMTGDSIGPESGTLVITEIMYMANYSEYVELHNPSARDTTFDTLVLDMDGARRNLVNVTVPGQGFLVVGRYDSSWVDVATPVLDLSSTSGNWITIRGKRGEVFDWVAFAVKSNEQQWPNIPSAKASIVLDSVNVTAAYNNYGGHWQAATSAFDLSATMLGTPGGPGR